MIGSIRENLIRLTRKRDLHEIMCRQTLDGILRKEGIEPALSPGGWAASSSLLMIIARLVTELPIKNVLELGCGQTTMLLAALAPIRDFKLTTIEHNADWAHFISDRTGHDIDLAALTFDGNGYVLNDLPGPFDLIIVDGPPGTGTKWSRSGAVDVVGRHHAYPCAIVLDDTHRRGEAATAAAIANETPFMVKEVRSTSWQTVLAAPQWATMVRSLA
ncbi:MAG: hypothetical protein ACR2QF_06970 [Geminicoccaceae bacterium]